MASNTDHGTRGHLPSGADNRALRITSWLTGIYFAVELTIGITTGSVSVISDAFHTFSAVGGVLLALIANRIAARSADVTHTFGRRRAEIIGALLNGFFLTIMGGLVIYLGIARLQDPIELATGQMLLVAAGGLVTEIIALYLLWSGQKGNLNMRGAFWHVMQTFIGSLIIIVSAVVIQLTGFLEIDPILGIAFGFVLIYVSWNIIKSALRILMETAPQEVDVGEILLDLAKISGVRDVHHTHSWAITDGRNIFSTHVLIDDEAETARVMKDCYAVLDSQSDISFSTVQVETVCLDVAGSEDLDFTGRTHNAPHHEREEEHARKNSG